jgi:hypothetical protein
MSLIFGQDKHSIPEIYAKKKGRNFENRTINESDADNAIIEKSLSPERDS